MQKTEYTGQVPSMAGPLVSSQPPCARWHWDTAGEAWAQIMLSLSFTHNRIHHLLRGYYATLWDLCGRFEAHCHIHGQDGLSKANSRVASVGEDTLAHPIRLDQPPVPAWPQVPQGAQHPVPIELQVTPRGCRNPSC